jgi:hypothetical protein
MKTILRSPALPVYEISEISNTLISNSRFGEYLTSFIFLGDPLPNLDETQVRPAVTCYSTSYIHLRHQLRCATASTVRHTPECPRTREPWTFLRIRSRMVCGATTWTRSLRSRHTKPSSLFHRLAKLIDTRHAFSRLHWEERT